MSFYSSIAFVVNVVLIIIVLSIVIWLLKNLRMSQLEKRLGTYATDIINEIEPSLFDDITNRFYSIIERLNKSLSHSKFLKEYSTKYDKYIPKNKPTRFVAMSYISTKFLTMLLFIFFVLIANVLQGDKIGLEEIFLGGVAGFFAPDIFLFSKKTLLKRTMKNDLLKAITIMNNAFKSGRSIMETIRIVSEELDGPLKEEFIKMYQDLNYGLEIETVFQRFSERVPLDEIKYITTSLTILNKTGGNIVEVFSSIERTVFNNRKLDEELKNLTAASQFLSWVLILFPIILVLVISVLDPTYFMPLIETNIGIVVLVVIILIYVLYIFTVRKIIRLKEY